MSNKTGFDAFQDFFTHIGNRSTDISSALSELAALGQVIVPVLRIAYPPAGAIATAVEVGLSVGSQVTGEVGQIAASQAAPIAQPAATGLTLGGLLAKGD